MAQHETMDSLEYELSELLNRKCAENRSNTPDFILARYMMDCLRAFETASVNRENWYGIKLYPGINEDTEEPE